METPELALALQPGDRIKIIPTHGTVTIECLYIGTGADGTYVLVPLCKSCGSPAPDEIIQGLCLYNAQMVEFTSTLLEVIDHPLSLWRIQVPANVGKVELRDSRRTRCTVSATFEAMQKGLVLVGIIHDISKSGARCIFQSIKSTNHASLREDDTITLRCEFPGIPWEQVMPAKITDVVTTDSELSIGIRFLEAAWWVPPYH